MARPKPDKPALLAALAAHVLENGLNAASLRPMAAAAGTSDRMLIYHFGSKDALIAALLTHLAEEMAAGLDAALPPARFESEAALIGAAVELMRSDRFKPYLRIWFDIVSSSAHGQEAHHQSGAAILGVFLDWVALRHPDADRAPLALTLVEGIMVMDAVGRGDIADAAVAQLRTSGR